MNEAGRICSSSVTENDIEYLLQNSYDRWTNEIPPNTPKALRKMRGRKQDSMLELEFEGFKVRNKFPQNILLMQDGSIVLCKSFHQRRSEDTYQREFDIHGHRMLNVSSVYDNEDGKSEDVGFFSVKNVSRVRETWDGRDVKTKCVMFPDDLPANDKSPLLLKPVTPYQWGKWFVSSMVL